MAGCVRHIQKGDHHIKIQLGLVCFQKISRLLGFKMQSGFEQLV